MTENQRIWALQQALEKALIGGNSLASNLIGLLGAGKEFPAFGTPYEEVQNLLARRPDHTVDWMNEYEQWVCWNAIMEAREMARAALRGYRGKRIGGLKR